MIPRLFLYLFFAAHATASTPVLPLAGEWRFSMDREDVGIEENWQSRTLENRITLPGILQSQGYGDDISPDTPWVLGLGGEWWKLQSQKLRDHFSQPGKVEVPFLSQPTKHYLGAAWYQRDIEIPADWTNQRVELFLERPRWKSTVWLGDREVGSARSLAAPHQFGLGVLKPGRHTLTVRLDNRMIVRDPKGNVGHMPDAHAVSDALGQTWNGIAGKIELRATPQVWLEDVQAFPNVAEKTARIEITLGNLSGKPVTGKVLVGPSEREFSIDEAGGKLSLVIPLGRDAKLWSEFEPALHELDVALHSDYGVHRSKITFGLREISWQGKELLLNGRPANLRTTHFGLDFPLTGYPATDVESWKKIIRRCQEFGLNGIRFHSCCPPDAAFTAADELGFYLQAEPGLWAPFYPDGVYTEYLEEETPLMLKAYGNHPSFVLFSPSNEPAGRYTQVTPQWAKRWYDKDPRRLYAAGTGWNRPEQVYDGAQFAGLVRFGKGELRNVTGWFGNDFRAALEDVDIPVLAHEIGQWCAYPDFDIIEKFTGYLRPSNYRIFRHIAEQNGLADINDELAFASGKFQLACYKEELEANLRTPGLAGHQMLDIRDYLGQGTALIGVLDAFWDPKSYVTGGEFRRFHSQTVPLARLKQRTFTTNETLQAEIELYHFGEAPIEQAKPYWELRTSDGERIRRDTWDARDVPIGKNLPLGEVRADLTDLPAPAAYKLVVGLDGTEVENDWNFWLYPADGPANEGATITHDWADASKRLAAGEKLLFVPKQDFLDPTISPPMKRVPIFWNIQMTVRPPKNPLPRFDAMLGLLIKDDHPALAAFPTAAHCDFQWTPIIDGVRSVNLTKAPRGLEPVVSAIDDWNRNWQLGVIFEARVGPGHLLVCAIPLNRDDPVTRQLRKSLTDYLAGDAFKPGFSLSPADADALWAGGGADAPVPERAFDPDLDDGTGR